jgi:NitT/TauT family transport system substrate-binding protein
VVLVVPQDSPIQAPADLRGRTVGVPGPFGETWFGLLALLKQAGLTEADVTIQHIGYTQQAALTTNQVDAVMGYANNDAVRLQAAGVPVRTLPIAEGDVPLVGIGLGAQEMVMMARTNDLIELNKAVVRAIGDIAINPEEAVTLSEKYIPGLAAEEQQRSALATLEATIPLFGPEGQRGRQNPDTWAAMSAFMDEVGLLAKPVPATEAYTTKIVEP